MTEYEALLRELVENGTAFYSAIELEPDFNGEEWMRRVREALDPAAAPQQPMSEESGE